MLHTGNYSKASSNRRFSLMPIQKYSFSLADRELLPSMSVNVKPEFPSQDLSLRVQNVLFQLSE